MTEAVRDVRVGEEGEAGWGRKGAVHRLGSAVVIDRGIRARIAYSLCATSPGDFVKREKQRCPLRRRARAHPHVTRPSPGMLSRHNQCKA